MPTTFIPCNVPTGKVKTFGEFGDKYLVGSIVDELPDGDFMVSITLLNSGEEATYRLSHLQDDPEAR